MHFFIKYGEKESYIVKRVRKMKILVTGGAGFIGSNIVDGLINNYGTFIF